MFFILSGFVYTYDKNKETKLRLILEKFKRLMIPFFMFTVVGTKKIYDAFGSISTEKLIREIFYVDGKIFFNVPLWFLIVLFEVYIVEVLLNSYSRPITIKILITLMLAIAGIFLYKRELNYFGFNRMIICLFFFEIGMFIRCIHNKSQSAKRHKCIEIISLIFMAIIWYILSAKINGQVSIYSFILGNYFVFIMAAILGSLIIMEICKLFFDRENVLCKLSRYSILLLGLQWFLIDSFQKEMQARELTKTIQYDVGMILLMVLIVTVIPFSYKLLIRKMPILKIMNGET